MTDRPEILPRHLSTELSDALTYSRVVNVIGARQVGKTTLVRDILQRGTFISLDDEAVLAAIEHDPWGQLQQLVNDPKGAPLIVDEAQRSKKLPLAIKRIVDLESRNGQFILTGSSNMFTTQHVADSLAGRVLTLTLWPLTTAETLSRGPSKILDWAISDAPSLTQVAAPDATSRTDYIDLILRGGFPRIRNLGLVKRQKLYRAYVDTVVERDVADIVRIRKTDALRRLIDQLAVRTGGELNIADLCGIVGLRRETLERYLDVLMRLSLIIRLGAWTSGEYRREIRNAKHHYADTGIAAALRNLSLRSFEPDANPAALGELLESFVFSELLRSTPYQINPFRFYHWRDQRGREIDIIAESANRIAAFEVKASTLVTTEDFRHLNWFAGEGPAKSRIVTSVVFYLGEQELKFGDRRYALPVSSLWSVPHQ